MARGIETGDNDCVEEFYRVFNEGFRYRILRVLGPEGVEDSVHTCLVTVISAIRRGGLQDPERMVGFANTIVKRHIAEQIASRVGERNGRIEVECLDSLAAKQPDPETQAERAQARFIMLKVFRTLSSRDHEVLRRFYLLGQSEEQICRDMSLTGNQFRNLKHRAKQRFVERWNDSVAQKRDRSLLGKRDSQHKRVGAVPMRDCLRAA